MKKRDRNKKERPSDQKEEREIKRIKADDDIPMDELDKEILSTNDQTRRSGRVSVKTEKYKEFTTVKDVHPIPQTIIIDEDVEEDVDVSAKTMEESVQVQASKAPKRKTSSKSKRKISDDNKAKDDDKMVSDHILHHD